MACALPLKRRRSAREEIHADEVGTKGANSGESDEEGVGLEQRVNRVHDATLDSDSAPEGQARGSRDSSPARHEEQPCKAHQHRLAPPRPYHTHHKRSLSPRQIDLNLDADLGPIDLDVDVNANVNVGRILTNVVSRVVILPTVILTEIRTITVLPGLGRGTNGQAPATTITSPVTTISNVVESPTPEPTPEPVASPTVSFADPPIQATDTPIVGEAPPVPGSEPIPAPGPPAGSVTDPVPAPINGPGPTEAPTPSKGGEEAGNDDQNGGIGTVPLTTITSVVMGGIPGNESTVFTGSASTTTQGSVVIIYTSDRRPSSTTLRTRTSSISSGTSTTGSAKTTSISDTDGGGGEGEGGDFAGGAGIGFPGEPGTANPTNSASSSGLQPHQQKLVGGILGGLAGIALILFAILFLIRRYKRTLAVSAHQRIADTPRAAGGVEKQSMSQRSSLRASFLPALAILPGRRQSPPAPLTTPFTSTEKGKAPAAAAESGFVKVHGRKMERGDVPGVASKVEYEHSWVGPPSSTGSPAHSPPLPPGSPGTPGSASFAPAFAAGAVPIPPRSPFEDPPGTAGSRSASGSWRGSGTPPPAASSSWGRGRGHAYKASMASTMTGWSDDGRESSAGPSGRRPVLGPRQRSLIGEATGSKDGVGRSLPGHDGSRGSRFTEDL